MDGTYYRFKQVMKLVEDTPNDSELGKKLREYYLKDWKPESKHHLTPPNGIEPLG
jgi:hypothetical protein